MLALLYLTVALVLMGALGIKAVSNQSFSSAIWEAIAGACSDRALDGRAAERCSKTSCPRCDLIAIMYLDLPLNFESLQSAG